VAREELHIGVDGGATEVKSHEVLVREKGARLMLGSASAAVRYERLAGFDPLPIEVQIEQHARGAIEIGEIEREQGERWLAAAAASVLAVAARADGARVTLGICLPGLKTADRRGTAVVRNGPRIPDYLDRLEAQLAHAGLEIARPLAALVGDGEACGHGERAAEDGAWRGIADGYYLGGGTGVAECLLLGGNVTSFDALAGRLAKAWELRGPDGRNYDDLVSLGGLNRELARRARLVLPLGAADLPEERALAGDPIARELLAALSSSLAELIVQRLERLCEGLEAAPGLPAIARGTVLERVVIGQRLGAWLAEDRLQDLVRTPLERALAQRIDRSSIPELRERCLEHGALRPGFLIASNLRAAPALGAIACAPRLRAARR
jgi:hypothetical protein